MPFEQLLRTSTRAIMVHAATAATPALVQGSIRMCERKHALQVFA
jgi:hypothetical protein